MLRSSLLSLALICTLLVGCGDPTSAETAKDVFPECSGVTEYLIGTTVQRLDPRPAGTCFGRNDPVVDLYRFRLDEARTVRLVVRTVPRTPDDPGQGAGYVALFNKEGVLIRATNSEVVWALMAGTYYIKAGTVTVVYPYSLSSEYR